MNSRLIDNQRDEAPMTVDYRQQGGAHTLRRRFGPGREPKIIAKRSRNWYLWNGGAT